MTYTFTDGSNNTYRIKDGFLSYSPMTKEMSSSGIYSGGEPFKRELSKIDLMRFVDVLERAIWNTSGQSQTRSMGSGRIVKYIGDETTSVILPMRSESMKEVNGLFQEYKM